MNSSSFELISEKLVKPSFSTPPSLKTYTLSLMDQFLASSFIPVAFFYPNIPNCQTSSLHLEKSLSIALSYYYPFAGRLTNNISVIDCNDMGVTFLEARIRSPMSKFLKGGEDHDGASGQDHIIFPSGLPWELAHDQPSFMVIQLSHFDCGGKTLSVCLRHNIADATTLFQFVNDWAALTRQLSEKPSPKFIGALVLPPDQSAEPIGTKKNENCVTRRFIFDCRKLSQLKAKATAESQVENPTRVEVVTALLCQRAMSATGSLNQSILSFPMNLRSPIFGPHPATQNYVGNFSSMLYVIASNDRETNFSKLVSEIRKEKMSNYEKYKGMTITQLYEDTLSVFKQLKVASDMRSVDAYLCTSWCGFPTHNNDFGWGSPIRVGSAAMPWNNVFVLTDIPNAEGDGIEAMVTLEEKVMSIFQNDPEILALAYTSTS